MQISYSPKPHNRVDYYPLPTGYADVFMHKNERVETDEDGNMSYVADEIYMQVKQDITKEQIEINFDYMWADAGKDVAVPSMEERLQMAEDTILFLLMGGI